MPLLHQDNSRGGGGPSDAPQPRTYPSIAEILDAMIPEPVGATAVARNECKWWDSPASPEAAQTPRSLVPAACFPTQFPGTFASFSESAQPGGASSWNDTSHANQNGTDHGIQNLLTSLALKMSNASLLPALPAPAAAGPNTSPPPLIPYDYAEICSEPYANCIQLRDETSPDYTLRRRASFCGVSGRNGSAVLRWTGQLPTRAEEPEGGFSSKLFLGGLPWEITESSLTLALKHFQPVRVEWPDRAAGAPPRGFAYVTFESERRVRALLAACRRDRAAWYYRLHARKMRTKVVQVIPWAVADANWAAARSARLEAGRTVFVGALHGMLSAGALASIMNDLFSGVVYAGIDTDKNKYPIGSGRVTFDNVRSYVRAISAAFIEIRTDKFTKKVQIDPYLEDSMCSICNLQQGPYFCREPNCFGYFCRSCWAWQHSDESGLVGHKGLMRSSKSSSGAALPPVRLALPAPPGQADPAHTDHGLFNGHHARKGDGSQSPGCESPPAVNSRWSDL